MNAAEPSTADAGVDPTCSARVAPTVSAGEVRTRWVVALTAFMMVAELVAGYLTRSLALTADGWHMATHVGALGLSALAYWYARTRASETRFAFGTGKVYALAGFTSSTLLVLVSFEMVTSGVQRLISPEAVDFVDALPVAIIGLGVNVVSALLLGASHDHAGHGHGAAEHGHAGQGHEHHDHGRGHDHAHGHAHDAHGHPRDAHGHAHDAHGHAHDAHGHAHDARGHDAHGHAHDAHRHGHDAHGHAHDAHGHPRDAHGHAHDAHGHAHDAHGHDAHGHAHDAHGHDAHGHAHDAHRHGHDAHGHAHDAHGPAHGDTPREHVHRPGAEVEQSEALRRALHETGHDHNLRAAYLHVIADALTSLLAIGALLAGRYLSLIWLDAVVAIVAALVILRWAWRLISDCARQLIDLGPSTALRDKVQEALEAVGDTRVRDLHLWHVGPTQLVCVASVVTTGSTPLEQYKRAVLAAVPVDHLTIEIAPKTPATVA
ncbi:MAG: cation transporter [Myxococcaceae bacterium]|nr:cation transporter [Myxococcaceae bacterium]